MIESRLVPSLAYRDAPAAIDWLERVFGFERKLVVPAPDGTIIHSELLAGSGVIMPFTARPEEKRLSPLDLDGASNGICIFVEDPDAHYERAKAEGAEITQEPKDQHFGGRGYSARDLEGHSWYFSNYVIGTHWEE